MKKLLLIILLAGIIVPAFSQVAPADTTKKARKNVIGVDATGLLQQFFNLNTTFSSPYHYPYILSYRRLFGNNAARIQAWGSSIQKNSTQEDTLQNKSTRNDFYGAIGFEHYCMLSKRWNYYWGSDVIYTYSYYYQRDDRTTTDYSENSAFRYAYGLSPFLGIQFRLNDRLSLSTEANYEILYLTEKESKAELPSYKYYSHSSGSEWRSDFIPPVTIHFRMQF